MYSKKTTLLFTYIIASFYFLNGQSQIIVNYEQQLSEDFDERDFLKKLPDHLLSMSNEFLTAYKQKEYHVLHANDEQSIFNSAPNLESFVVGNLRKDQDSLSAVHYKYRGKHITRNKQSPSNPLRIIQDDFSLSSQANGDTETILGYTCLAVEVKFCSENFVIYYTPELPYPTGPRSFVGFPGLVLKVKNLDESWVLTATKLDIITEECREDYRQIDKQRLYDLLPNATEISYTEFCEQKQKKKN